MERRKFLIGAGALAAGGAAAMGSGAFTSVDAQRTIELEIVEDQDAFLGLEVLDDEWADDDGGTLELDFTETEDGDGLNPRANTRMDEVFEIRNQGSQGVTVWIAVPEEKGGPNDTAAASTEYIADGTDISFPEDIDVSDKEGNPAVGDQTPGGAIELEPGDAEKVDMRFLVSGTTHVDSGVLDGEFIVRASADMDPDDLEEDDYKL